MRCSLILFLLATYCSASALDAPRCNEAVVEPTVVEPPPHVLALDLATGNWKTQATRSFVVSGIAAAMERLCADQNGGHTKFVPASEIAKAAGLLPETTYRLLRFLSTIVPDGGICSEGDDKDFALGPVGDVLTPNHPNSVADTVVWEASPVSAKMWAELPRWLEDGESVAPRALDGAETVWEYFDRSPEYLSIFSRAMTGYSNQQGVLFIHPDLSPTFDLSAHEVICDLGSAQGQLALKLAKRFPNSHYILADLPQVLKSVDEAGLPPNFSLHGTNFLKQASPKADAYLLKLILHDWTDEDASKILTNIHAANPNATIYIIEFGPMPGPNIPHIAKGFDIHMGIFFGSGARERKQEEYDALFDSNGYERVAVHLLAGGEFPVYVQEVKRKKFAPVMLD